MLPSIELPLALTTVVALVHVVARPAAEPAPAEEPRRVMFAAGVIRKRRGEKLQWS